MSFGSPTSVDRMTFWQLPEPMQVEGIRLMLERGATSAEIGKHLRMDADEVLPMAWSQPTAFRRPGEEPVPGGRGI